MVLFADSADTATVWAVLMTLITSVSGIAYAILKHRKDMEIQRLNRQKELREELAKQKASEAMMRAEEMAAMKRDMNSVYAKWKDIAEVFQNEKNTMHKMYEAKCAECVELRVHLEECRKQLQIVGDSDEQ